MCHVRVLGAPSGPPLQCGAVLVVSLIAKESDGLQGQQAGGAPPGGHTAAWPAPGPNGLLLLARALSSLQPHQHHGAPSWVLTVLPALLLLRLHAFGLPPPLKGWGLSHTSSSRTTQRKVCCHRSFTR